MEDESSSHSINLGDNLLTPKISRSNNFFDKINEQFFRPRGLYCLVMTWKPESPSAIERFDLNSAISTAIDGGGPGILKMMKHTFKSSDGMTYGGLPFPESAPLIFPDLDELAAQGGDLDAKLKKSNSHREFVGDYWDRRSQAKFVRCCSGYLKYTNTR